MPAHRSSLQREAFPKRTVHISFFLSAHKSPSFPAGCHFHPVRLLQSPCIEYFIQIAPDKKGQMSTFHENLN